MRLLNARTLAFHEFYQSDVPPYAILSHTWDVEEPSFQDMMNSSDISKKGYLKIQNTCRLALQHGLDYAWVDTCCIDKLSSAELTESINSMYQWYQNAKICFVWLEDLYSHTDVTAGMPKCRWFTRGWTLQELLAPKTLEFYDAMWALRGSKQGLTDLIARITRIPLPILWGTEPLSECSTAMKMSWAASRSTTRLEDRAYCLLGIFDVNMPLIYGEGEKAFRRLQEEIVKRGNDLTIFAWDNKPSQSSKLISIFAASLEAFSDCSDIKNMAMNSLVTFSISNRGLLITGGAGSPPLQCVRLLHQPTSFTYSYLLTLGSNFGNYYSDSDRGKGGIFLRKVGPALFCRDSRYEMAGFGRTEYVRGFASKDSADYCILTDNANPGVLTSIASLCRDFRRNCIWIPDTQKRAVLVDIAPYDLWDWKDRVFLKTKLYSSSLDEAVALIMVFKIEIGSLRLNFIAICSHTENSDEVRPRLVKDEDFDKIRGIVFDGRNQTEYLFWPEFVRLVPEVTEYHDTVTMVRGSRVFTLQIEFKQRSLEFSSSKGLGGFVPRFRYKIDYHESDQQGPGINEWNTIIV